jgi:uncharacterized protein (TIGR02996 family)
MDEDTAFVRAIAANQDDSALLSVYADWLEERGDPRCEYLRLQGVHAALVKEYYFSGDRNIRWRIMDLRARLRQLGSTVNAEWLALVDEARRRLLHRCRCCICQRPLVAQEAIDVNPFTQQKLKVMRYCQNCWEDAVRSRFHRYFNNPPRSPEEHYYNYYGTTRDDV